MVLSNLWYSLSWKFKVRKRHKNNEYFILCMKMGFECSAPDGSGIRCLFDPGIRDEQPRSYFPVLRNQNFLGLKSPIHNTVARFTSRAPILSFQRFFGAFALNYFDYYYCLRWWSMIYQNIVQDLFEVSFLRDETVNPRRGSFANLAGCAAAAAQFLLPHLQKAEVLWQCQVT